MFVLLVADHASDDYELFLYEVTDGKLKMTDQQDNLFIGDGSVSAGGRKNGMLMLKKNVNVFGSYQCSMTYSIGDDGKLVPDEEFFQVDIDNYPYSVLTVTRELPVSVNGGQTTLQTGTQIRITGTNLMQESLCLRRRMEKYLVKSIIQSRKVTLNSITRSTASPKTSILNPFHMRDREYTGQICVIIKIRRIRDSPGSLWNVLQKLHTNG